MKIKFVKQDCWIGLYWKTQVAGLPGLMRVWHVRTYYLCLVPCFPIMWHRRWTTEVK